MTTPDPCAKKVEAAIEALKKSHIVKPRRSALGFFFGELIMYLGWMLISLALIWVFGGHFVDEQLLTKFVDSKVNETSLWEVLGVIVAYFVIAALVNLVIDATRKRLGLQLGSTVVDDLIQEAAKTLYYFGGTITAASIALALFYKGIHNSVEEVHFFKLGAGAALVFFAAGCGWTAWLLSDEFE